MWIAEEAVDLRYAVGLKSAMPKIGDRVIPPKNGCVEN